MSGTQEDSKSKFSKCLSFKNYSTFCGKSVVLTHFKNYERLSEKGYKVLVIKKGKWFKAEDFKKEAFEKPFLKESS